MSSVGIIHERFPFIGGAERVAIEAARVCDAPIYTTYVAPSVDLPSDVVVVPLLQSKYVNGLSGKFFLSRNQLTEQLRMMSLAVDISSLSGKVESHDIILSSGSISKHYLPQTEQTILHYPHTPPRYYYDLHREAIDRFDGPFVSTGAKVSTKLWRIVDKEPNDYVDKFVANSEVVRDRIKTYYNRDAELLYPPVVGNWRNDGDDGYFVTWSRLDSKKRIDLIIRAFADLDEELIIAGDGPERKRLERLASNHNNITIKGFVDDIESLVARARAVVYAPQAEDFGLVGAETLRAGKPLLGVNEGFTKYQITPETGRLFSPTVRSLADTVASFEPNEFDSDVIRESGRKYTRETFARSLEDIITHAC